MEQKIPIWELKKSHTNRMYACVVCAHRWNDSTAALNRHQATHILYIKNVILWFRQCVCVCILPTSHIIIIIVWTVVYSGTVYLSSIVHASHRIMLNAFRLPNLCSIRWLTTMISLSVTMNGIWSLFYFFSTSASTKTTATTMWAKLKYSSCSISHSFWDVRRIFFISTLGNSKWNERDRRSMATEYETRCSKNDNFSLSKCVRWRIKIHIAFKYARDRATMTATSSHYTNNHIYDEDGAGRRATSDIGAQTEPWVQRKYMRSDYNQFVNLNIS